MKKSSKVTSKQLSIFSKQLEKYGKSSPRIIFTSSSQVYKKTKISLKKLINETYKAEPETIFGIAKKTSEDLIRLSGFEHAIIRIANVSMDQAVVLNYNSVIATFCHKSVIKEPLKIDGDGLSKKRFYIHRRCYQTQWCIGRN